MLSASNPSAWPPQGSSAPPEPADLAKISPSRIEPSRNTLKLLGLDQRCR